MIWLVTRITTIPTSTNKFLEQEMQYYPSGQLVLQTTDTEIDVSALPAGIYLVRSQTTQGEVYQAKIVHL